MSEESLDVYIKLILNGRYFDLILIAAVAAVFCMLMILSISSG